LPCNDLDALAELLRDAKGKQVAIHQPLRGIKCELVHMAHKNAAQALAESKQRTESAETVLAELQQRLQLSRLPKRIECYDISTIQGRHSVGSGVAFVDAAPDKSHYRHYRINQVTGQDDFAMLREIFQRRFREDVVTKNGLPDLVVVDGGIGQLNATAGIVEELGLTGQFDMVSLAKSRVERGMRNKTIVRSDERIFLPGRKNPVVLKQNSRALLLLAAIRDEAHRFAITYHRKLRSSREIGSELDQIKGVGKKRRLALLQHFGSFQKIREASIEELGATPGVTRGVALKIFEAIQDRR
jgi:excinuclease ABC subunit C